MLKAPFCSHELLIPLPRLFSQLLGKKFIVVLFFNHDGHCFKSPWPPLAADSSSRKEAVPGGSAKCRTRVLSAVMTDSRHPRRASAPYIFARALDIIALAGPDGVLFGDVVTKLTEGPVFCGPLRNRDSFANARTSEISVPSGRRHSDFHVDGDFHSSAEVLSAAQRRWLRHSLSRYPALVRFVHDNGGGDSTDKDERIVASEVLQLRALRYSKLEHARLVDQSWSLLRLIGEAGPRGISQNDLCARTGLPPRTVHHYVMGLANSDLVVRHRVSIQGTSAAEGYITSWVALARFAKPFIESAANIPRHDISSAAVTSSLDADVLMERGRCIMNALREHPKHTMTHRELKSMCMPEHHCPPGMRWDEFMDGRHKSFRNIKEKLVRANLVVDEVRCIVGEDGQICGKLPCLRLVSEDPGGPKIGEQKRSFENAEVSLSEKRVKMMERRRLTIDLLSPSADVDVLQRVYEMVRLNSWRGTTIVDIMRSFHPLLKGKHAHAIMMRIVQNCPDVVAQETFFGKTRCTLLLVKSSKTGAHSDTNALQYHDIKPQSANLENGSDGSQCTRSPGGPHATSANFDHLEPGQVDVKPAVTMSTRLPFLLGGRSERRPSSLIVRRAKVIEEWLNRYSALKLCKLGRFLCRVENASFPRIDSRTMQGVTHHVVSQGKARIIHVGESSNEGGDEGVAFDRSGTSAELRYLVRPDFNDSSSNAVQYLRQAHKKLEHDLNRGYLCQADGPGIKECRAGESIQDGKSEVSVFAKDDGAIEMRFCPSETRSKLLTLIPKNEAAGVTDTTSNPILSRALQPRPPARAVRVGRYIAIQQGWCKGLFVRTKILHRAIWSFVTETSSVDTRRNVDMAGPTLPSPREQAVTQTEPDPLGIISEKEIVHGLTVREFAQVGGVFEYYSSLTSSDWEKRIGRLTIDVQRSLLQSPQASLQINVLISWLYRLKLISPKPDLSWAVSSSGVLRDFGQGMPDGMAQQRIALDEMSAVDRFWTYLELFKEKPACRGKPMAVDRNLTVEPEQIKLPTASRGDPGSEEGFVDKIVPNDELHEIYDETRWQANTEPNLTSAEKVLIEKMVQRRLVARNLGGRAEFFDALPKYPLDEIFDKVARPLFPHLSFEKVAKYVEGRSTKAVDEDIRIKLSSRRSSWRPAEQLHSKKRLRESVRDAAVKPVDKAPRVKLRSPNSSSKLPDIDVFTRAELLSLVAQLRVVAEQQQPFACRQLKHKDWCLRGICGPNLDDEMLNMWEDISTVLGIDMDTCQTLLQEMCKDKTLKSEFERCVLLQIAESTSVETESALISDSVRCCENIVRTGSGVSLSVTAANNANASIGLAEASSAKDWKEYFVHAISESRRSRSDKISVDLEEEVIEPGQNQKSLKEIAIHRRDTSPTLEREETGTSELRIGSRDVCQLSEPEKGSVGELLLANGVLSFSPSCVEDGKNEDGRIRRPELDGEDIAREHLNASSLDADFHDGSLTRNAGMREGTQDCTPIAPIEELQLHAPGRLGESRSAMQDENQGLRPRAQDGSPGNTYMETENQFKSVGLDAAERGESGGISVELCAIMKDDRGTDIENSRGKFMECNSGHRKLSVLGEILKILLRAPTAEFSSAVAQQVLSRFKAEEVQECTRQLLRNGVVVTKNTPSGRLCYSLRRKCDSQSGFHGDNTFRREVEAAEHRLRHQAACEGSNSIFLPDSLTVAELLATLHTSFASCDNSHATLNVETSVENADSSSSDDDSDAEDTPDYRVSLAILPSNASDRDLELSALTTSRQSQAVEASSAYNENRDRDSDKGRDEDPTEDPTEDVDDYSARNLPSALNSELNLTESPNPTSRSADTNEPANDLSSLTESLQVSQSADGRFKKASEILLQTIAAASDEGLLACDIRARLGNESLSYSDAYGAVQYLLKQNKVCRFCIESSHRSDSETCCVVYMMYENASRHFGFGCRSGTGENESEVDNEIVVPLTPWSCLNGRLDSSLCDRVQASIVSALTLTSAMEEGHLCEQVAECGVPRRAIVDVLFAMLKAGRVGRSHIVSLRKSCTLFSQSCSFIDDDIVLRYGLDTYVDARDICTLQQDIETVYFLTSHRAEPSIDVKFVANIATYMYSA